MGRLIAFRTGGDTQETATGVAGPQVWQVESSSDQSDSAGSKIPLLQQTGMLDLKPPVTFDLSLFISFVAELSYSAVFTIAVLSLVRNVTSCFFTGSQQPVRGLCTLGDAPKVVLTPPTG